MNITQVASVAGAFEASRNAGVQQAGTAAASATVQRQAAKAASEADVRETETVKEPKSGRIRRAPTAVARHHRLISRPHRRMREGSVRTEPLAFSMRGRELQAHDPHADQSDAGEAHQAASSP